MILMLIHLVNFLLRLLLLEHFHVFSYPLKLVVLLLSQCIFQCLLLPNLLVLEQLGLHFQFLLVHLSERLLVFRRPVCRIVCGISAGNSLAIIFNLIMNWKVLDNF